jgi:hypothetical protein
MRTGIEVGLSLGAIDGWLQKEKREVMKAATKETKPSLPWPRRKQGFRQLTERAIRLGRNDTLNLSLLKKCFAWKQERKNVTFLSIGIGTTTQLRPTASLNDILDYTSITIFRIWLWCKGLSHQFR